MKREREALEKAVEDAATIFEGYYLEYVYKWWIQGFGPTDYARRENISEEDALKRINIGRVIHEQRGKDA